MWDFLTKKCGIFGIEGGTKLWDFQHQGGDFRPLTSGHTAKKINKIGKQTAEYFPFFPCIFQEENISSEKSRCKK